MRRLACRLHCKNGCQAGKLHAKKFEMGDRLEMAPTLGGIKKYSQSRAIISLEHVNLNTVLLTKKAKKYVCQAKK